jgi:protein-S-isoprenylcysteine O-methyltransferase Ste14
MAEQEKRVINYLINKILVMSFQKLKSQFKENWKGILLVAVIAIAGVLAVSGDGFADLSHHAFWWHFWAIIGIVCLVGLVVAWAYAWNSQRTDKNP